MGAIDSYNKAQRRHLESHYNGINVIALTRLLQFLREQTGEEPEPAGIQDLDDLAVVVRVAAQSEFERTRNDHDYYADAVWSAATLAELELLIGDPPSARRLYERAAALRGVTYFHIGAMLNQLFLYEGLGFCSEVVPGIIETLNKRRDQIGKPTVQYDKVVVFSGHMIDKPDRKEPRFPPEKEGAVREQLAKQLKAWKIGPGDLAICGGARGGDILFAELCAERKAPVLLLIALPEAQYLEESVRLPGSDWEERYRALRGRPPEDVRSFFQEERLGAPPEGMSVFERNNIWVLNTARAEVKSESLYALLVWDEKPGCDGPSGTSDFASRVKHLGVRLCIVNPTKP